MFVMFAAILSTLLLFWSDRAHFSDPDKVSKETVELTSSGEKKIDFGQFQGGRVLVLVHGYNNTEEDAAGSYHKIMQYLAQAGGSGLYTHVIGYLWPGYDDCYDYFAAKEDVEKVVGRMSGHLDTLSSVAESVDILAHSMGNRLILDALLKLSAKSKDQKINHYYSFAAAVGEESIERKQTYFPATQLCSKMYVFHSSHDDILKFVYLVAEDDEALGGDGDIPFSSIPKNVQFIDCTPFVDGHTAYFEPAAFPLYQFICNSLNWPGKNLAFLQDGSIVSLHE